MNNQEIDIDETQWMLAHASKGDQLLICSCYATLASGITINIVSESSNLFEISLHDASSRPSVLIVTLSAFLAACVIPLLVVEMARWAFGRAIGERFFPMLLIAAFGLTLSLISWLARDVDWILIVCNWMVWFVPGWTLFMSKDRGVPKGISCIDTPRMLRKRIAGRTPNLPDGRNS